MSADPALVPELYVRDIAVSRDFYVQILGFACLYERPEERFCYLDFQGAHLMLDQIGATRDWLPAPLETPFGRGINLQIRAQALEPILDRLPQAHLFMAPETKWYRTDEGEAGQRQMIVRDPDGYLLRFAVSRGTRLAS